MAKSKTTNSDPENGKILQEAVLKSLDKLSLVRATLHDENLSKLEGYKLDGTIATVDEVFNLLDTAFNLYAETQ